MKPKRHQWTGKDCRPGQEEIEDRVRRLVKRFNGGAVTVHFTEKLTTLYLDQRYPPDDRGMPAARPTPPEVEGHTIHPLSGDRNLIVEVRGA